MLLIISLMLAGLALGAFLASRVGERVFKAFGRVQQLATIALLFAMGLWLGGNPEFWQNVSTTGLHGFLLALGAIAGSVAAVYFLTRHLQNSGRGE
jgi:uncharacterized protein YneF (UPF0154 family)